MRGHTGGQVGLSGMGVSGPGFEEILSLVQISLKPCKDRLISGCSLRTDGI